MDTPCTPHSLSLPSLFPRPLTLPPLYALPPLPPLLRRHTPSRFSIFSDILFDISFGVIPLILSWVITYYAAGEKWGTFSGIFLCVLFTLLNVFRKYREQVKKRVNSSAVVPTLADVSTSESPESSPTTISKTSKKKKKQSD